MNKTWPFTLNFLLFAALAFVIPFLVLYYQSLGFTGAEIGLLTGLTPLVTMVSAPFWTGLADKTRRYRFIMSLAILVSVVILAVVPGLRAFVPVLLLVLLYNAFNAPVFSFTDSATMFMLGDKKDLYGRIRLGGTIGFGIAAFVAGVFVQNYGLRYAFWEAQPYCFWPVGQPEIVFGAAQPALRSSRESALCWRIAAGSCS
jgi:MFS family permease